MPAYTNTTLAVPILPHIGQAILRFRDLNTLYFAGLYSTPKHNEQSCTHVLSPPSTEFTVTRQARFSPYVLGRGPDSLCAPFIREPLSVHLYLVYTPRWRFHLETICSTLELGPPWTRTPIQCPYHLLPPLLFPLVMDSMQCNEMQYSLINFVCAISNAALAVSPPSIQDPVADSPPRPDKGQIEGVRERTGERQ